MPAIIPNAETAMNFPLNPGFEFLSFTSSWSGDRCGYRSGSVACRDQDAYGDVEGFIYESY